jgi:MerR family transcriptional regulator, heat shock protein HspR
MTEQEPIYNRQGDEPRYVISIAARMLNMQTHTLRYYEKIGVITPSRSRGHIRLYSEHDIAQLRRVKTLIEELGVNVAGVEVILRMMQHMNELQDKMTDLAAEVERLKGEH